jgi:hypothetical protein
VVTTLANVIVSEVSLGAKVFINRTHFSKNFSVRTGTSFRSESQLVVLDWWLITSTQIIVLQNKLQDSPSLDSMAWTTLFFAFSVVLHLMLLLLILPTTLSINHSTHVETSYIVLKLTFSVHNISWHLVLQFVISVANTKKQKTVFLLGREKLHLLPTNPQEIVLILIFTCTVSAHPWMWKNYWCLQTSHQLLFMFLQVSPGLDSGLSLYYRKVHLQYTVVPSHVCQKMISFKNKKRISIYHESHRHWL